MRPIATLLLLLVPVRTAALELDEARWAALSAVARDGFALAEVSDRARYGRADHWAVADADGGDCEDKALRARAVLQGQGWPAASLRIAMAWTETRDYHAVLTIDVERRGMAATYVIDNRFPWVVGWDALGRHGYRWDRRQVAGGTGWVRIAPGAMDAPFRP